MRTHKRFVDPAFFLHEGLARLEPHYRLLFIGLWVLADREGVLLDRPAVIHALLFPHEQARVSHRLIDEPGGLPATIDVMLDRLASEGFIERYEAQGERLVYVRNFKKWQSVHKNEARSKLPPPPSGSLSDNPPSGNRSLPDRKRETPGRKPAAVRQETGSDPPPMTQVASRKRLAETNGQETDRKPSTARQPTNTRLSDPGTGSGTGSGSAEVVQESEAVAAQVGPYSRSGEEAAQALAAAAAAAAGVKFRELHGAVLDQVASACAAEGVEPEQCEALVQFADGHPHWGRWATIPLALARRMGELVHDFEQYQAGEQAAAEALRKAEETQS